MKDKFLLIPNCKEISKYNKFTSFILPLENFSIGFDTYFNVEEINELSNKYNIYVMINRFMHKNELDSFKKENKFNDNIKGFFIEDIGLKNILDINKIILFQNHIINNHEAINYLNEINIKDVVISNELTIDEIKTIKDNTKSELYYFLINRNMIMYSKRKLLSNYFDYYKNNKTKDAYLLKEKVSGHELLIKEEDKSNLIFNNKLFVANKHLKDLLNLDHLIINLNNLTDKEEKIVLENYDKEELVNLIDCDYYFLENEISYKVGDLK